MLFQKMSTVLQSTEVIDNVKQKGNTPDSLRREVAMSSLILSTAFFDVSQSMATPCKIFSANWRDIWLVEWHKDWMVYDIFL